MADSSFATRLLRLRKQAKMTQQAVAARLNIHRTTYTKYESGAAAPDQQGLVALGELFGVSVDFLLGREGEDPVVSAKRESGSLHLSLQEQTLVQMFRQLNYRDQQTMIQRMEQTFRQLKNRKL